jgi:acetylornithine deacetylase
MNNKSIQALTAEAIQLLKKMIAAPSFSGQEDKTAELVEAWFTSHSIPFKRKNNNIWAYNLYFDESRPTLLLNSHHDTVKPNQGYILDPFSPIEKDKKLYGLGSNDAGGCLVSLLAAFTYFFAVENLSHNLIIAATAEEESSGPNGLNSILSELPPLNCAIVGEPTGMHLAIAEKGLLVLDVVVKGTPGHAAHENNNNAIYNALEVAKWFRDYTFDKVSDVLGPIKMTVTGLSAGTQHNVVPAECHMVVDVRVNDCYTNVEVLQLIQYNLSDTAVVTPRSLHLNSSSIAKDHPLVQAGISLERNWYGSPTLSDQSVLSCQSLKLGPGVSARSHSADEFIYIHEIEEGVVVYCSILTEFLINQPAMADKL